MMPQKPKKEEQYQYLVKILRQANVDSREKAEGHIRGLKQKAYKFSAIPLLVFSIGSILLPSYIGIWAMLCLFGLAWIWSSTYATTGMMKKYIKKEFDINA
ncbi:MAG: hypothetical protein AAFZ92_03045 [Pseudomonadota bacterium]